MSEQPDAVEGQQTHDSAVDFATPTRVHVGLPVLQLSESVKYYTTLFGTEPSKLREGYARFEVADPPLNLSLNQVSERQTGHPVQHFGIQVKSRQEVVARHGTLRAAGFATLDEQGATCCFAVQDKVWSVDPDGHRWEVFVVLDDAAEGRGAAPAPLETESKGECCA